MASLLLMLIHNIKEKMKKYSSFKIDRETLDVLRKASRLKSVPISGVLRLITDWLRAGIGGIEQSSVEELRNNFRDPYFTFSLRTYPRREILTQS